MVILGPSFLTGSSRAGETFTSTSLPGRTDRFCRSCDTRDVVLKRDGTNIVQSSTGCTITGGTWVSPYDGATWTASSDVDIDHLVPLSNAWKVRIFSVHWLCVQRTDMYLIVGRLCMDHSRKTSFCQ